MFYYISGKPMLPDMTCAVIDAGGIGYRLTVTQNTHAALSRSDNETVKLYTHMAVREDGVELFGFYTTEELEAFKLLISVSGVGPKAAISILSQLSPRKLSLAIVTDDKKAIAQANGIGPKTAARIILELKDKLKSVSFGAEDSANLPTAAETAAGGGKLADAQEALMALGYSRSEAASVLGSIDTENREVDEIIRLALKKIMK